MRYFRALPSPGRYQGSCCRWRMGLAVSNLGEAEALWGCLAADWIRARVLGSGRVSRAGSLNGPGHSLTRFPAVAQPPGRVQGIQKFRQKFLHPKFPTCETRNGQGKPDRVAHALSPKRSGWECLCPSSVQDRPEARWAVPTRHTRVDTHMRVSVISMLPASQATF